ncbi:helix-turn-helix domain-containing protein [Rhizorhabdus wittichii]|uniref:Helix-turn-helix domain-containing protein n=2 Tax=Rhizorhabdus wittichii TaxID=160791 RepID=A0A975D5W4_9SPHN|nr:helix-turn-helix domain-containing protein [Rhizorhabdus wittichii]
MLRVQGDVAMSEHLLSTDTVRAKERLPYWCDMVCDTFVELDCESQESDSFSGELRNIAFGAIQISMVESVAQRVRRTRSRIAGSTRDHFLLSLQLRGTGAICQDSRVAKLSPGDFALYDSIRPYELRFDDSFSQVVLRLPRETVTGRLIDSHMLTARRIDGQRGVGLLASSFIRQLHEQRADIDDLSLGRLQANAVDLMATALAEQTGGQARTNEGQAIIRQRVCAFIDRNLGDHRLTCEGIAAAHGISQRYLRKIFESSSTTVSDWIWSRRLEQAKADLSDPLLAHVSVTAIGFDVGFKDAAHFSRAFRSRFGMSPREWRNSAGSRHN